MKKSRIKNALAAFAAVIMVAVPFMSVNAAAANVEYSASSSYMSSSFYTALKNVKLTGDQATDIAAIAKTQVGYHESNSTSNLSGSSSGGGNCTEYGKWYGMQSYWCNVFVSWCAYVAGVPTSVFPKLPSATASYASILPSVGAQCFKFSSGKALQTGDLIFSCTCSGGYGCIDHVGLVVGVDSNNIYTVEGNLSDKVQSASYPASTGYSSKLHARINYVARPQYEDNSKKAADITDADSVITTKNSVYALFDVSVSLSEAEALCKNMGGHLVSVTSEAEQKKVAELASNGEYERYYSALVLDEKSGEYKWSTGEKVDYTVMTASKGSLKATVINSDGTFSPSTENRRTTGFICEIDKSSVSPANTAVFGGSRYEIYDTAMTYNEAKAFAASLGGKLVTIETINENMLLSLLLKESKSYFTGMTGTKAELLSRDFEAFKNGVKLSKSNNITVLTNNSKGSWATGESFNKAGDSGFIIEYDESEKYTVIYDANGGTDTPIEQVASLGEALTISDSIPQNKDKKFLGWSENQKSKTAEYNVGDEFKGVSGVTTFFAVWG